MNLLTKSMAVAAVSLLAACEGDVAGDVSSSAAFGTSTTTNTLAQAVSLQGELLAQLQAQFRAAAPDLINFEFNQSTLDAEARQTLALQAAWIKANPGIRFRIYGHTDLVGSNSYNRSLGLRRAQAAVAFLISQGVRRGQVEAVASFGETRPLINTQSRERLNRRTVTEIVGFDRRYKSFDFDGKVANAIYTTGYVAGASQ